MSNESAMGQDGRVEITAERALELIKESAKRIYELQAQKRKEELEGVVHILSSLGLDYETSGPLVPEVDESVDDIENDLAWNFAQDGSDRYILSEEVIKILEDEYN